MKLKNTQGWVLIAMIIMLMAWRFTDNLSLQSSVKFSPFAVMVMLVSAYVLSLRASILTILGIMLVSDLMLMNTVYAEYNNGFLYNGWMVTYTAIACMGLFSKYVLANITMPRFFMAALGTALIHWAITNTGVWYSGMNVLTNAPFEKSWTGLATALYLGLPFLKSVLISNVVIGGAFFGINVWMAQWIHAYKPPDKMKAKIGIVGGAGYTAGELIRLLIHHPNVEIVCVYSTSNAGNPVSKVHDDLLGLTPLTFSDHLENDLDVLFLCLGHGHSVEFLSQNNISDRTRIIDMSNDFRLPNNRHQNDRNFVYGLPELQRKTIQTSQNIANPGGFATAIQLALLPLAQSHTISDAVHVSAITGSTGAGQSLSDTTHFTWRANNLSVYKTFTHQHLDEIQANLVQIQPQL